MTPKTKPNLDHSLFKKNNASALTKTITKKTTDKTKKIKAVINILLKKKQVEKIRKTNEKKNPNFLFEGSSTSEYLFFFFIKL